MLQPTFSYRTALLTSAGLAGIAIMSSGCVSTSKYEALEAENASLQRANDIVFERGMEIYRTNIILSEEI